MTALLEVVALLGDNDWDWHPDLAPARVLVTTAPPGSPWFVTMTEAGILAKVGLNQRGLASALNFLPCSVDGGLDGVPIHLLLRALLERCWTAADALELLIGARVSASACVTIAVREPGGAALFALRGRHHRGRRRRGRPPGRRPCLRAATHRPLGAALRPAPRPAADPRAARGRCDEGDLRRPRTSSDGRTGSRSCAACSTSRTRSEQRSSRSAGWRHGISASSSAGSTRSARASRTIVESRGSRKSGESTVRSAAMTIWSSASSFVSPRAALNSSGRNRPAPTRSDTYGRSSRLGHPRSRGARSLASPRRPIASLGKRYARWAASARGLFVPSAFARHTRREGRPSTMRFSPASLDKPLDPAMPLRVVIADDHILLRQGVASMLEGQGFEVVAQAGDADDVVRKVSAHRPDVAVVDIRMPPDGTDDGLRAAIAIRHAHPEVGVLVLSQYVEADYAVELIGDDARGVGYLLKDRIGDFEEFATAVRRVAAGGSVLDPEVVKWMFGRERATSRLADLTPREREVLALLAEGCSNRAVAQRMFISERAVEKHVTAILSKLGLPAEPAAHRRVLAVLAFLEGERAVTGRA